MKKIKHSSELSSNGSQSLVRGLHLLDILSNFPNGCPLAKISELAELNKSTTHRLLQSLQAEGYVKPAHAPGSYRLSTKCLAIGQKTLSSLNIINIASPILEQVNLTTGETVNFSIREDDHAIMIYKLEPTTGMMRTRSYIGQHLQLYCSAMGKIFMAYDSSDYLSHYWQRNQSYIKKLTNNTITTIEAMIEELETIRTQGYAIDNEENELGVTCIAFPIFDINRKVSYSVSISLSTARLQLADKKIIFNHLQQAASLISSELGFSSF